MPKLIDAVIKMKGQPEHHKGMIIFSGKVYENAEPLVSNSFSFVKC